MTGNWGSVLTELIPLALVVALSPLSIIPGVLALHGPRPRPTGLAFMTGWLVGLALLTSVFVGISELLGDLEEPPRWASWVRIVVGAVLIVFGAYRWLTRHKSTHMPAWMRTITTMTPMRAGITGFALTALNLKVLFICAAAGLSIGTGGLGDSAFVAVIYYTIIAGSTVALPILAYAASGDRLTPALDRLKAWMEQQHAVLIAGILVVIGLLVLYKGIHGLTA